jgi:hypothetical protein
MRTVFGDVCTHAKLVLLVTVTGAAATSVWSAPNSEPSGAEFAIRWEATASGPASAAKTLKLLERSADKSDTFEVWYFDVVPPTNAPLGFEPILRMRLKNNKSAELTFKYRWKGPPENATPLHGWSCPLSPSPEIKNEVDVSFDVAGKSKKTFSHSCSIEGNKDALVIPVPLAAKPKSCKTTMVRLKASELKVEEWKLPGNRQVIEVSRNGKNNQVDRDAFSVDVVVPLLKKGKVVPEGRSKTELGSSCSS